MKKLISMLFELFVLGLCAKIFAPILMVTAFDLIICFTLIKVMDIQYRLKEG